MERPIGESKNEDVTLCKNAFYIKRCKTLLNEQKDSNTNHNGIPVYFRL